MVTSGKNINLFLMYDPAGALGASPTGEIHKYVTKTTSSCYNDLTDSKGGDAMNGDRHLSEGMIKSNGG